MNAVATRAAILGHPEGRVLVHELEDGQRSVTIELEDPSAYVGERSCTTRYPVDLIEAILRVKGPAWLCYSLRREEDPLAIELVLREAIFSFVDESELRGKRLLDFGCGSGSSTVVLSRMLPETSLVGIDIEAEQLEIARLRARHHGAGEIAFLQSPSPQELPPEIGSFDAVLFSAVLEHMLPAERTTLLPQVWSLVRPGGVLFLNQTPHRWFPLEHHTTGLPLINYLPPPLALRTARRLSNRVDPNASWDELLRAGIRGATERQVVRILRAAGAGAPRLLRPIIPGRRDGADIWFAYSSRRNPRLRKRLLRLVFRGIGGVLRSSFAPDLNLALRKEHVHT